MVQLLIKYGGTGAGKAFMKLIGVDCGWSRSPVQKLSEKALQDLRTDLEKIGFFNVCSQL
jgi:N-acetylneuraminate lyase